MKEKIIVIAGPTASGKSDLAVYISKYLNGEVISADSMQIYRNMNIGTAKISVQEMRGVPHHMIDIADIDTNYSVAEYQKEAFKTVNNILSRGKIPVITGGTGLYVHSLICDVDFTKTAGNSVFRKEMNALSSDELYKRLLDVDPEAAARIHSNDKKRIIRRLEILSDEKCLSDEYSFRKPNNDFDFIKICITMPRSKLYERIDNRVDAMINYGLVDEVSALYTKFGKNNTAMQAIGYKEIISFLDGKSTLEESVDTLKRNSRRYAKRQLTWFRREEDFKWFDMSEYLNYNEFQLDILKYIEGRTA